jgi:hypothetical protein
MKEWLDGISATDSSGNRISEVDLHNLLIADFRVPSGHQLASGDYDVDLTHKVRGDVLERMKHFRILLGSLVYKDVISSKTKSINLAHMPIAMESFADFMYKRVISSNRKSYPFNSFVKDLINDIILKNMSHECFGGYFANNAKLSVSLLTANASAKQSLSGFDVIAGTAAGSRDSGAIWGIHSKHDYPVVRMQKINPDKPIFDAATATPNTKETNYMLIAAHSTADFDKNLHGDVKEDERMGIPHFRFGSATGFLKSANFKKSPIAFQAEERFTSEGSEDMLNQLANRYEMTMNMIGNNLFLPGQYVYFDPVAMGVGKPNQHTGGAAKSFANIMSLGGYHIITEVSSHISAGKFETSVKALWETSGRIKK